MTHVHEHNELHAHNSSKILLICFLANILFVAIEAAIGYMSNSTSLVSDAGHNLSDALGLLLSLIAISMERHQRSADSSKYVTLINALLLLVVVAVIVVESIEKILNPMTINSSAVIGTALIGIVINGLTAWLLMRGNKKNINIKAAYLHAASDTLVSVGVVISGVIIRFSGWDIIDPILSLLISLIIAIPSIKLFLSALQSLRITKSN